MREGLPAAATPLHYRSLQSLQTKRWISTASLITIAWDAFITLGDEVTYIWPKPSTAHIKWLYLIGKYVAVVTQVAVYWFEMRIIAHSPMASYCCLVYTGIQTAEIEFLLIIFDFVLLIRIYAFYGWKTLAGLIASCALVLEGVTAIIGAILTFPGIVYDSDCTVISFPNTVLVVAVGTFVSQAALLWLAYRKKESVARAEQGRTSIASTTIRDGVIAFVCIITVFLLFAVCQLSNSVNTNLAVYWLPVFVSLATTRVIMNIQQVAQIQQAPSAEPSGIELTTQLWTDEYALQSHSYATSDASD